MGTVRQFKCQESRSNKHFLSGIRDPGSGFRKTKHGRAEHEVIMNKKLCYVYNSVQRVYYLPFYFEEEADLTKCITGWPICLEHQAY